MSDALTPLRQVYGLEPASGPETPEHDVLRTLRDALDARPALAPAAGALDAVLARAAESHDVLTFESEAQAAALAPVLDALDRLPRPAPSDAVIAAVEARAAESAGALAAVRHVYAGGGAPAAGTAAAVEAEVLHQSREAVERSLVSRPQARPAQSAVDAVLARAAQARRQSEEVPAESAVEDAVLAQSLQALDRLPRYSPSVAALDAVVAAAAVPPVLRASGPKTPASRPAAPARDRAAAPVRRRPVGVWAGAGVLALVAAFALTLLPRQAAAPEAPAPLAVAEQVEPASQAVAEADAEEATPPPADPAPTPFSSAIAAASATAGGAAVTERPGSGPSAPAAPPARTATARPTAPQAAPVAAATPTPRSAAPSSTAPAPSWEASDDVRALSLRLQELDEDALAWDEPSEVFGTPAPSASGTPGVQAVGATRARARMIDTDQR